MDNQMENQLNYQLKNQSEMNPRKILSMSGFGLFFMAAAVLLSQMIIELVMDRYVPEIRNQDWYVWALTAITMLVIGFPIYYFVMKRIPNSERGETVKLTVKQFFVIFFICVAAMYISNYMGLFLTILISIILGNDIINPALDAITNSSMIYSVIYGGLIAPIIEEIIFRKILLDKLRRFGDVAAILLSGLAFGLFHMNLSQFFYAAVLGFIFAYVTLKTNTVRYSITLHIMINLFSTLVVPLLMDRKVFLLILGMWIIGAIITGIVLFCLNVKKITFTKAEVPLVKTSYYFSNIGWILFAVVCIIMIVRITTYRG